MPVHWAVLSVCEKLPKKSNDFDLYTDIGRL
jgi:hypothetical protein